MQTTFIKEIRNYGLSVLLVLGLLLMAPFSVQPAHAAGWTVDTLRMTRSQRQRLKANPNRYNSRL